MRWAAIACVAKELAMKFRSAPTSAMLAASLVIAPVAVNAAPVAERGSAAVEGEQLSGGLAPAWIVAATLVVGLGILVFSDDDDEEPVSP
jgi:hypothetical protein